MLISILLVVASVPILFYAPGRAAMYLLKVQVERTHLYSFAASTLVYGLVAILGHMVGLSQAVVIKIVVGFALVACLFMLGIGVRSGRALREIRSFVFNPAVLIFVTAIALRVLLSGLIPDFWRGGDWYFFHYDTALAFLPHSWNISPDRPPLFSLISSMFMAMFGSEFWVAQIVGDFLNSLFLIPSYYICKQLFGRKTAISALVFLSILPYFSYNAIYYWPKLFAAYFVLLSFYELLAILRQKPVNWILYMTSMGLAYMAHQYSLLFGASGLLIALLFRRLDLRRFLQGLVCFCGICLPWWLYNQLTFGFPIGNCQYTPDCVKYYPFAVGGEFTGIPPVISTAELYQRFFATPVSTLIWMRVSNLLITFIPFLPLLEKYFTIPFLPTIYEATWGFEFVYQFYSVDNLFGALTISLSIFLLISLRHARLNRTFRLIAGYVGISAVLMTLEWGWFMQGALGFGTAGMFPAFALLTIAAVAGAERLGNDRAFVFIGSTFETMLFYVFLLSTANSNPQEPTGITLFFQFTQLEHWSLACFAVLIIIFYFCILADYNQPWKTVYYWIKKIVHRTEQSGSDVGHLLSR